MSISQQFGGVRAKIRALSWQIEGVRLVSSLFFAVLPFCKSLILVTAKTSGSYDPKHYTMTVVVLSGESVLYHQPKPKKKARRGPAGLLYARRVKKFLNVAEECSSGGSAGGRG